MIGLDALLKLHVAETFFILEAEKWILTLHGWLFQIGCYYYLKKDEDFCSDLLFVTIVRVDENIGENDLNDLILTCRVLRQSGAHLDFPEIGNYR